MKSILQKLYILSFMVLVVGFSVLIWNLTFGHVMEEYKERKELEHLADQVVKKIEPKKETSFEQVILKGEERVKHYLGYKILETKRIKGHFHHVGTEIGPDKHLYCGSCHGDIPHNKTKELRAFLNMHSFFISCQTCHVELVGTEKTDVYKWYNRETGEIVPSPIKESGTGSFMAKIVPFIRVDGKLTRIDTKQRREFVEDYRQHEQDLSQSQKSQAQNVIHQIITKQPHTCEDCHQKENPLLPLKDLGYPKERIDSVLGTEIVGMIRKYTDFYMPRILHPGQKSE